MTHPADKVYRFRTLEHWGQGRIEGFLFADGPDGILITPEELGAEPVARASGSQTAAALTTDPCGRLLWLLSDGTLMATHEAGAVQVAVLPRSLARNVQRLIWGQRTAWAVSGGSIVRLDARGGARTGGFDAPGWRVVDAVADLCDGVIAAEVSGQALRFRRIRADGQARVLGVHDGFTEVIAAVRWNDDGPIHAVVRVQGGFQVVTFPPDGGPQATHEFSGPIPSGAVAMAGPGRLLMAASGGGIFTVAFGLMEPLREIRTAQPMAEISNLLRTNGLLYAAAGQRVWALREVAETADAKTATWYGPVLRSPRGDRSGWLRADLWARLPEGARVRISSRAFEDARAAAAYRDTFTLQPGAPLLTEGWKLEAASEHFGDGMEHPLRHYLGDETAEYLALRLEVSVPACAGAARLNRLDVLYPNRSLIEDMPTIYRPGTESERQMRRMLAPFQALADEIDDLIGDGIRRVDPDKTDDLWTGFLLHWLGHGEFTRLPADQRRALLVALPEILQLRGTLAGLVKVMEILAPEGFSIEDSGTGPDVWVLPKPMDPAGARLGRETLAARHRPGALRLGHRTPLGVAVLRYGCLDLALHAQCSGTVTVRAFGGEPARERLEPFTGRIARTFAPANTRMDFTFGDHRPPRRLERGAGIGPNDDAGTFLRLNDDRSRALGAWRLPREGTAAADHTAVLGSAHLDGSLTLE